MADLAINQASHGHDPFRMPGAIMTIGLAQSFITAHPANGMLHLNPTAGKGGIKGDIFSRTGLTSRFAPGGGRRAGPDQQKLLVRQL